MRLYVGDDWAEDHHDVEVMNEAGKVLAKKRLPEGASGMSQLHGLIGRHVPEDADDAEVVIGIETDRGPWVAALIAAGYTVYPANPLLASRYRERHAVSGAKSDGGDAHMLADMVRTDSHQLRPAAGDSPEVEGIKVVARTHKTMIWDRTRTVQRLRHQLREYFPAALEAFDDLDAPDVLELLAKAPEPARAAKLTRAQVAAALKRARRHHVPAKTDAILAALRGEHLGQPAALTAAYAATVRSLVAVLAVLNEQVSFLEAQVKEHFGRHPDAEIYQSQPGMAAVLGARVLAEFGDDPYRYESAKARKNYAGTPSPVPRARRRSSPPALCATTGSLTRSWPGRSRRCWPRPGRARSTTSSAPRDSNIMTHSGGWPTVLSASCTAASRPAPSMTRTRPGATARNSSPQLDKSRPGVSVKPDETSGCFGGLW